MYRQIWKRCIDIVVSLVVLGVTMPVLSVVALLLAFTQQGGFLFLQQRPGRFGKPFTIYKFKTMSDATDARGRLLPDQQRITPVGRLVRKLSLDELLQLVNVLKGDMSLIGPRPLLMDYLPRYSPRQARRHEVRPGITGLAQVKGRNALSWEKRFRYDVFYVDHVSLRLDLLIAVLTVRKVLKADEIDFVVSESEFKGTARHTDHPAKSTVAVL
jgi:lipopolysaccharide/colanic/teichoic acid biosynthesis glycosyltransferase